jgi:CDP-glucose 4,6-dehydratase
MHFLITGHTGFKGTWLSLMLWEMGHEVSGISLQPEPLSLFDQLRIEEKFLHNIHLDIRSRGKLQDQVAVIKPDVIIHLAAQSLVRKSYREPILTYETNFNGTLNILSAASTVSSVKSQLIITTDKVYKNEGHHHAFNESDPLGGEDPYSTSKALADLLTQTWMKNNQKPTTAIARAGNVIGGGDVCEDRLVPDLVRAYSSGVIPNLRFPHSVRPWQHVLDCLNGYVILIENMLQKQVGGIWNFGPNNEELVSVETFAEKMAKTWGAHFEWNLVGDQGMKETPFLALNSRKSQELLAWKNKYDTSEAISTTVEWYKRVLAGESAEKVTLNQIRKFLDI